MERLDRRIEDHLKEVFEEELGEVAFRLAMARVAEVEGYDEVARALKDVAYDEAKHASLIAELLYTNEIEDTKSNLLAAIDVDRYAERREQEFLTLVREAGDERVAKLVEQLISDEADHVRRLEEAARKLGWHSSVCEK